MTMIAEKYVTVKKKKKNQNSVMMSNHSDTLMSMGGTSQFLFSSKTLDFRYTCDTLGRFVALGDP